MKLIINEPPIPQSRPRFDSRNKRAYEKSNIKSYKQRIGYAARKEFKKPIERDIPLEIEMKFYIPIPQYLSKVKKNRLTLDKEVEYVTKKPDLDNLLKAILDGLNGIAYFDDGQVAKLKVEKVYSFNPRTEIEILALEEE
ncbi:RusA family crossover junction endodeoxyribonuclease [Vagococcus fluvialis]|uniref:RusA family crossover junction endodeoxyribonuclease n=1 Tax=Vagococcus fluvialis TaxID=2738 RepID=A0A7X6D822_9ENTE|nr:RusA family crossover junction endodeoxyribonuclease [Vagococcus fluvialis]NKC67203.1 RusA family crossover junction endodeoxyribonuclease [Vagococcus fluvialis]